jgi:predicted membrane protein DUF2079
VTTADVVEIAPPRRVAEEVAPAEPRPQPARRVHAKRASRPGRLWRGVRIAGWVTFTIWFVVLALLSLALYHRFFLAQDFGLYNQAWTQIGTGHLDPSNTIYGLPFIRSNFELILWPLALLHLVYPQPIVLLWVQDLCVAGSGLVAFLWVVDILERSATPRWVGPLIASAVVLVTVANPGMYQTVGFDVHMEPIATLFLLLAGRDLWRRRFRRAWLFAGVALLCGAFAAIALIGLGISALLAGRDTRRHGLLLMAAGVGWSVVTFLFHVNPGTLSQYSYLAGRGSLVGLGGLAALVTGVSAHPARLIHQFQGRLSEIWVLIRPAGVIGLASAWGIGVPAMVLLTDALNSQRIFITAAFQNFAVFPFVLVGTVMVLVWAASRLRPVLVATGIVGLVALVLVGQALTLDTNRGPGEVRWLLNHRIGQNQAAELQTALSKTPANAEVISTLSVMGRFCGRDACYFFNPWTPAPVQSRVVVFVFAPDYEDLAPVVTNASMRYIRYGLHARVLVNAHGVTAFEWTAPPHTAMVTVPPIPSTPGRRT